jgi:curved DNA-binding protein CbpA
VVQNLYEILGLKPHATTEDIRSAYRRLAREHHPDITGHSDAVRFREIRLAYEILSDPLSRARHDRGLDNRIPVRIVSSTKPRADAEPLIPPRRAVENFARGFPFAEQPAFEEIFNIMERLFFHF